VSDAAALITALSVAGTAAGGALGFVWNKAEKWKRGIEAELADCRMREQRGQERRGRQRTVIELLLAEMERLAPATTPGLRRAKKLLAELKVIDAEDEPEEETA
jgi:hypothetical protein